LWYNEADWDRREKGNLMADSASEGSPWTRAFFIVVPILLGIGLTLLGNACAGMSRMEERTRSNEKAIVEIGQLRDGQIRITEALGRIEKQQLEMIQRITRLEAQP